MKKLNLGAFFVILRLRKTPPPGTDFSLKVSIAVELELSLDYWGFLRT